MRDQTEHHPYKVQTLSGWTLKMLSVWFQAIKNTRIKNKKAKPKEAWPQKVSGNGAIGVDWDRVDEKALAEKILKTSFGKADDEIT